MKMKIITVLIVIVIICVLAGMAWGSGLFENPYWETKTSFGIWQEEIVIEYIDGSSESLKIIDFRGSSPLTLVTHNEQEVSMVKYNLYAIATGVGYETWEYDEWHLVTTVLTSSGSTYKTYTQAQIGRNEREFDKQYQLCYVGYNMNPILGNAPVGQYTIKFEPQEENLRFKGNPDGEWQTVAMPPGRQVTIDVSSENTISLLLTSDYTAQ